ncbi:DNA-3-methyladenine glycosylase 2 family protein [Mycobacterium sp. Y57]|uniref:DNA-3-methyladenine glycosylase 2 family protein n=1 Tax=Mycolicibacterium xanthum TaxID=2796469 RepID=UPI001C860FCD|nr:DNA-3-methyladenine glycosylase 2 family protein [Mycolicibacterium xanthum]MBX7433399.1 DNA-3-methyladenine glycosylase 2 family protein [Mycolicibacterium xanthum]
MHTDFDRCYRAVQAKDARFDGWFVTAVLTTGIYCRPSCPVRPPYARNVRFYPTAAAAQRAGFRACKRCRPDASPGSPEWNVRGDVVARAMRLIADGTVDRDGVSGLAVRLGYTVRQLERLTQAEVGATPLSLARAQRAQMARVLIETTEMPFGDVAFAAGFTSIRQFNDTVHAVYDLTPTMLRTRARTRFGRADVAATGTLSVRLPVRTPFAFEGLFGHLAASAVPGVEEVRDGAYRRSLRLPHGTAIVALTPHPDHVRCRLEVADFRDVSAAIARCRRLLDLDADPEAIVGALSADERLAPLIAKAPGQRIPRTVDEQELALRVVLGQQVSVAAARTHAARLVAAYGDPIADAEGGLTHVFPSTERLGEIDPQRLAFPKARQSTLGALIAAMNRGDVELDSGCDWNAAREQLQALLGIGPWSAEMIAMRGLGDPDAFPGTDLGVAAAARQLGLPSAARGLAEHGERWRPWRSYATQHLWTALDHSVNAWPPRRNDETPAISNDGQPGREAHPRRYRRPAATSADGRPDL